MKNLEQIRALHALKFWQEKAETKNIGGKEGGDVVRRLSSLILNNGLLATLAFAKSQKGSGYETFMLEIGQFLASTGPDGRNLIQESIDKLDDFIKVLTSHDSIFLSQVTQKSLAYLSYLKRFASSNQAATS